MAPSRPADRWRPPRTGRRPLLAALLAVLAAGLALVVGSAVRDLLAAPSFEGALRLVVEAVALIVVAGGGWRSWRGTVPRA
ncbi:MAG: hypothetical protein H0V93_01935 [Euzebyales bacterium]|nr:hypothetical protein [Euzebyales bacterium]